MLDTEESGDNQNDDSSQNDENIVAKDTSDKDVDHTVDMDIPNDLPVNSD